MAPPKLTRTRIATVPEMVIKNAVLDALKEVDICEWQSSNHTVNPKSGPCIRDLIAEAIAKHANVTVEKRKRCGTYGRDGLWIGLPEAVYQQLLKDALNCLPPASGGGPPPNMGFTLLP